MAKDSLEAQTLSPSPVAISPLRAGVVSDSFLSPQHPVWVGADPNSVKVTDKNMSPQPHLPDVFYGLGGRSSWLEAWIPV